MSAASPAVSDMLVTVKSREIQRALLAEMRGDQAAAPRHFLAAAHLELVLAEDYYPGREVTHQRQGSAFLHPEGVALFSPGQRPGEPRASQLFFTPKGWSCSAQGNALGTEAPPNRAALKGHSNASGSGLIAPFQGSGCMQWLPSSQGVALG